MFELLTPEVDQSSRFANLPRHVSAYYRPKRNRLAHCSVAFTRWQH